MEPFSPQAPNLEALAELRKLIAQLGGGLLPEPSGWDFCEDCSGVGACYPVGRLRVCSRCWLLRRRVADSLDAL